MIRALTEVDDADPMKPSAAYWDARLRAPGCTAADREDFDLWLAESDDNAAAFARLQTGLKALQEASRSDPRLRAIRDRARGVTGARRRLVQIAASLLAVVIVGTGAYSVYSFQHPVAVPVVYQTAAGERSTVRLDDGSVVTLSAKSEVHVAYSPNRRNIALVRGEAMFKVAKNHNRPFVVAVGEREVTAVGTAFDVKLAPELVRVTMLEGRVQVKNSNPARAASKPLTLVAGQKMTLHTGSKQSVVEQADMSRDLAWLEGRLIFEGETLEGAVAEVNRYTEAPVKIGDASLKNLPISGMFKTSQPGRFVDALVSYYPIEAKRDSSGEVTLLRR
jgi:transmembrane sensor